MGVKSVEYKMLRAATSTDFVDLRWKSGINQDSHSLRPQLQSRVDIISWLEVLVSLSYIRFFYIECRGKLIAGLIKKTCIPYLAVNQRK